MECPFCHQDPDTYTLVHRLDGSGQVMACIPCAIQQGLYCEKHQVPHSGHDSGGTVCMECIKDDLREFAGEAPHFYTQLMDSLPEVERARIREWTDDMGDIWGEPALVVLRGLVMEARRRHVAITDVVQDVIVDNFADAILPRAY
ncbi:MAG: hypothetical protein G01um101438_1038 [Parcubacteria group bacterium Gr01-1014_38]|nr:MAG: hypothetical protein G01um101438_1038 [Parcubacteria group bacterium Gr01-1014_38]